MIERARFAWGFLRDRRGSAAVEFAFLAPVLLSLYFVTMEVSQGIDTSKKVSRAASMIADLVTQQAEITKGEIDAILRIGEATLQPYNRTQPTIIVTAIEVTDESTPKVKVVWSRKLLDGAGSKDASAGTIVTVPDKLKTKGSFLIRVESQLGYKPVVVWTAAQKQTLGLFAAFDNIAMSESYFLRPRMSTTIPCGDC